MKPDYQLIESLLRESLGQIIPMRAIGEADYEKWGQAEPTGPSQTQVRYTPQQAQQSTQALAQRYSSPESPSEPSAGGVQPQGPYAPDVRNVLSNIMMNAPNDPQFFQELISSLQAMAQMYQRIAK